MAYDWRKEEYEVTRPGRTRIDFRQEIGRAHVPIGVERGFAVVHIFRFDGDRIVELWDLAQEVPDHSPNANGMF